MASDKKEGSKPAAFEISRIFDAPREVVWRAHTECEHLKHWWGPKGCTVTFCRIDLRPGGFFHYCLRWAQGEDMWGKFLFREVVEPQKLVFILSFSDEHRGTTRHPMSPDWPLEMLNTTTFSEKNGKTTVTVRLAPHNATDSERAAFEAGHDGMRIGFGGTFDQLAAHLSESKS